jgi:antitoxin VapB
MTMSTRLRPRNDATRVSCVLRKSFSSSSLTTKNYELTTPQNCQPEQNPFSSSLSTENGKLKISQSVYTMGIYIRRLVMATAKVFKSGNSQAVRLPKAFRVKSKEVEISRRGDEIVLRERPGTLARAFDVLAALPADVARVRRTKDRPQKRKGL